MRATHATFRTAFRRLTALALGLWLSGAGCLACCERPGASAHAAAFEPEAAAHTVAAARTFAAALREPATVAASASAAHSCCTARVGSRARKASPKGTSHGDRRQVSTAARREAARTADDGATPVPGYAARVSDESAGRTSVPRHACCRRALKSFEQARDPRAEQSLAHAPSAAAPDTAPPAVAAVFHVGARARAPDRAGTYLRCCVLLI